jgi:hypothetical protein
MIARAWAAWERFWFAPTDPLPLALVRIALGALMTVWACSLASQLPDFYTASGITGAAASARAWYAWSVLGSSPEPMLVAAVFLALLVAAPALTVGWHCCGCCRCT